LHADVADAWRPFAVRFVQLADGELEPATEKRHTLPMG
jgi:hypothetical protein